MSLTDRASILRAFYRLTGTSGDDGAMTQYDDTTLEGVYNLLQHGVWDAQLFLIQLGEEARWLKTETLTSSWSGADATDGGRYTALPSNFLRLAGDEEQSALHYPNGRPWGRLIEFRDRRRAGINCYWLQGDDDGGDPDNLWISRGSAPPSTLEIDHHFEHPTLADGTTVHFPKEHRPLIPAFAAERAIGESWLPIGEKGRQIIDVNLTKLKRKARSQVRRSQQPRKIRRPTTLGRWWR